MARSRLDGRILSDFWSAQGPVIIPSVRPVFIGSLLGVLALASCQSEPAPFVFEAPAQIRRALSFVSDLQAEAQVVARGQSPTAPIALSRADDGVSFSAFIPLEPGEYTVEVAFTGVFDRTAERIFLGRWTSDLFTVTLGNSVTAVFSQPIDRIGRPEDEGDLDGDGLAIFDELLWGADPARTDSDGDGLVDGKDCDPGTVSAFPIAADGSIDDCDGDGAQRPDLKLGEAGRDCNDQDRSTNPSATDTCGDGVNSDCNPETCPEDTVGGPSIDAVSPPSGTRVGCHTVVRATITDSAPIQKAEIVLLDDAVPPQVKDRFDLVPAGGSTYARDFNEGSRVWIDRGSGAWSIRAAGASGGTSTITGTYDFALDLPSASVSPSDVGARSAPFDLMVNATAVHGVASIRLFLVPYAPGNDVSRAAATELASATASPASFSVDPSTLAEGQYLLFVTVEDSVGNRLQPERNFGPGNLVDGTLDTDPDYLCEFDTHDITVPVRQLVVGAGGDPDHAPAKMRDHLDEAIQVATAMDSGTELVEIQGWGVGPDGVVHLEDAANGSGKWWAYEFHNFADNRHIVLTWNSAYYDIPSPEVDVTENYAFTVRPMSTPPATLVDSDLAATAYGAASCEALTGIEDDGMRYENNAIANQDVVRVDTVSSYWLGSPTAPVSEIRSCN